ncbi:hypothetical protein Halha_0850 [Halobacteroides halobius DSM 5150]|uniref:Cell division protein SepF n=1 Tax=Halobacteroides halobius (strain ATCC 35273 / DSM 5150 / MD-1) TaxID=748449 RepID=L0K747_HALHC|nr:cell division protein SepF [Halobacteroides halobius]AGB40816.1 hypothetical protein Halha_0850 [Halobacteroides halobius DSM 5150]
MMDLIDEVVASAGKVFGFSNPQLSTVEENESQVIETKTSLENENVTIIEPNSFAEVQKIVDKLKDNNSVIIRLYKVEPKDAVKIIDFISGAVYALDGSSEKIGKDVFLFVPSTVQITYDD